MKHLTSRRKASMRVLLDQLRYLCTVLIGSAQQQCCCRVELRDNLAKIRPMSCVTAWQTKFAVVYDEE